jgi:Tfp pilus assembly pilus retraction ATPase PilT
MDTGGEEGMLAMDKALALLVRQGRVSADEAGARAIDQDNFQRWLSNL